MMTEDKKTSCIVTDIKLGKEVYAVSDEWAVYPHAIFQCRHCAEEYANTHLFLHKPFVHELPMGIYAEFFRNGKKEIAEAP